MASPFWSTWWFWALFAAVAVALVFIVTRRVRRHNKLLQRLVTERTHELEAAQEQLVRRERLAVLGELAGAVAHELRNPLGVIKNSAYFLRLTQQYEGTAREHLEIIEREVDRSGSIITDLLDFGRNPQPRFRRTTLQKIVVAALASVSLPDEIDLEHAPETEPLEIEVDPDQIARVLVNLVRNAVQAMPDGGRLRVGCSTEGGKAIATVADDGVGIAEHDLTKIFEPLFTSKAHGIGLGLAESLRYSHLNRGTIEVESEAGKGAVFRLVLPLAGTEVSS